MERKMLDYYPHVLRSYGEIKGVADSQQWLFERLWAAAERVFENQFVETMDDMGLTRWEHILGIRPKGTAMLEERRFAVLLKLNQAQLPYTYRSLRRYLGSVSSDFETRLNHNAYYLWLRVRLEGYRQRDELAGVLRQMLPANIVLFMRTEIPQEITGPRLCFASGVTVVKRHRHKAQAYRYKAQAYREGV